MQALRLTHAGIVLKEAGNALVIDPGSFTSSEELAAAFDTVGNDTSIQGLVITHEHADHWTLENVQAVLAKNPDCQVFTTEATAAALGTDIENLRVVHEGDQFELPSFKLTFYGKKHELLHSSIPLIDNVGVNVNDTFYYGGDSLMRTPFLKPDLVGVPIGSPWSNLTQVLRFVEDTSPKRAYFTHEAMLSQAGLGLFKTRVKEIAETQGTELITLPHALETPGEMFTL